ncbi:MAG: hypothetical protein J6V47_05320 [Bacteroidaceae bacterium]|nr:hypothetical protein [Bacteroidaceae bacterium]
MKIDSAFPDVLIIGVGGGGCNIVGNNSVIFGVNSVEIDNVEQPDIDTLLNEEIRTVFIVTCLGGEYGSAVAPQIAAECRKRKLRTIGVATLPFEFEGAVKTQRANATANELAKNCDSLNLVHNEIMLKGNQTIAVNEAFKDVNMRIWEIITKEIYSTPVWFYDKSEYVIKNRFKKRFGWLHKNEGALVCKSFIDNDYKITRLCIDIVERKAKRVMGKRWFNNLSEDIKFKALLYALVCELWDDGGQYLISWDIVYDVLTISRKWQIQGWLLSYEAVDCLEECKLANKRKASVEIYKRRKELLSSLNNATE